MTARSRGSRSIRVMTAGRDHRCNRGTLEDFGWIDPDAWSSLMWSTAGDETSALRRMIRDFARRNQGFVLVIDDAHTVVGTAYGRW
jgi:hypothetical protein